MKVKWLRILVYLDALCVLTGCLGGRPGKHKSKGRGPEGASYFHFDDIPIKKQKTDNVNGGVKREGNLNVKVCPTSIKN